MYFETSLYSKYAVYDSDTIKANTPTTCLKFAYHMYGADMGQLALRKMKHDGYGVLFYNTKSENRWKEFEVTLPESDRDYKVSGIFQK